MQKQQSSQGTVATFGDQFIPPDEQKNDEKLKFQLKNWWSVIQANKFKEFEYKRDLYERALKYLPSCYKLWYNYLVELIDSVKYKCTVGKSFENVNKQFEKALSYLMRMPKIWLLYVQFLKSQDLITKTRQVYDQALKCLPVTQHDLIWGSYSEWALQQGSILTAIHVFRRYIKINHNFKENLYDYLREKSQIDEAASILHEILHDDSFVSAKNKSKYDYYIELCDLILEHFDQIKTVDCEKALREGITKYVDQVGNLWVKLSEFYIKFGKFEKARDTFGEGLLKVMTARDFSIVYNAYLKFEEELVNAFNDVDEKEFDEQLLNEQISRLEKLISQRPFLLVEVELRVNPHSVKDWLKKISLFQDDQSKILNVYGEAINTIDPQLVANGQLSDIWCSFGQYYYKHEDYLNGNKIFQKAVEIKYKSVEDIIKLWCFWAEVLVREGFQQDAIQVAKLALFNKNINKEFDLHSNLRLWSLYIDLEINFGTFETIKQAYKKMLELKVITPQMLLNYAQFLEQNSYFEESFKVYESGIAMFKWPGLYDIWLIYLKKFISRYQRDKLERTRDLFEKVISNIPKKFCQIFYQMYAEFEEEYGLLNHAFEIYDRMVGNIEENNKLQGYLMYIGKVSQFLGVIKTRPIYEAAMNIFKNDELVQIGLKFSQMEKKFEEIDRVRAIYQHISQFIDPKDDKYQFWKLWQNFELYHGNEDTNLEFERIKRTVKNKYSLMPVNIEKIKAKVDSEMAELEKKQEQQQKQQEAEQQQPKSTDKEANDKQE